MAGRRIIPIRARPQAVVPSVDDPQVARAIDVVADAVQSLQQKADRVLVTADLVIGTNKVRHGLGRACRGYNVTPSVATIAFAHALNTTNPRPDLEVWISVVGSDMPKAQIEVY